MNRRAALYARISRDRVGAGLGVERQESDCRDLAEHLDATVVGVFRDNDMSAYSGKPRPGYLNLVEAIERGDVDVVLCWHTDRLHRSPAELEEWITACDPRGVAVHTVKAGPLDLATPSGRMVARQLGAVARYEVEHMIERQQAAKAQAAAAGKYRGGRRPFGYEPDGVTVRRWEARVVADMTTRVLAGESLHSLARELNEREITTSTGRPWRAPELRSLLLRARNAGLIEHTDGRTGEHRVIGDAEWEAIVEPAQWRNVVRLLTDADRRLPWSRDEVHLGSGLFLCGRCDDGTTMRSASTRTTTRGRSSAPAYRCRTGNHLTRIAGPLDAFVSELVIERLSRPDARLMLALPEQRPNLDALLAEREDVEGRLAELAGLFADGAITGPQLAEGTRKLRAEGDRVDGELSAAQAASPLAGFADADNVRGAWEAASVSRRKAVVRELMTVTLLPAPKGRPAGWSPGSGSGYFDPRAVRVEWRA